MKNTLLERICFRLSKEVTNSNFQEVYLSPGEIEELEDSFYEILDEEFGEDNYICGKQNLRPTLDLEDEEY